MILFSAEAIFASSTSKFGIEIPLVDDEDLNSSTESTNSTSLVHCIASVGNCEQSTYLGRGPYLPASKGCWCRELVTVKFRNLQSLLVLPIILWRVSSTEDDWIFGWRSRLASQISILFWSFTFLRCRRMKRLLNWRIPLIQFLRIRSWWRCMWIYKNVSRYTMCVPNAWRPLFAARRCERMPQQSFRYQMRWERHWSTGNVGTSTANWFSILEVLRIVHTIYFILQFLYSAW